MANISQHEAAELWELARDNFLTAAKLQFLGQHVHDTQLRSLTEQHARRMQQAGHQIAGLIGQDGVSGQAAQSGFQSQAQNFFQFQSAPSFTGQQLGYGAQGAGQAGGYGGQSSSVPFQAGAHGTDILVAGECLKDCKRMAVSLIWGATESSQPARSILYQLAGEQLQMAEQHYRWLEQKGLYASPKADSQTTHEYSQKVRQIAQAGQQATQEHAALHQENALQPGQFGHSYGNQSPAYSTQGQFGAQSQQHLGTPAFIGQYGGYQQAQTLSSTGAVRTGQQYSH